MSSLRKDGTTLRFPIVEPERWCRAQLDGVRQIFGADGRADVAGKPFVLGQLFRR
ncbi:MAG: hypothetical protein H6669_05425 [Ardenticatenaceae bacterium]|nr:hypothetical protein [Ardenticatenaceae bacterium]